MARVRYSNSERSEEFLLTECFFLSCSWRLLISNELEQLEFKLEKNIGIQKHEGKVRNRLFILDNIVQEDLIVVQPSYWAFFLELCQDGDLCFGFPISIGLSFLLTIENAKVSQILPTTNTQVKYIDRTLVPWKFETENYRTCATITRSWILTIHKAKGHST